jgi:hypothetical protein
MLAQVEKDGPLSIVYFCSVGRVGEGGEQGGTVRKIILRRTGGILTHS